MLFLTTRKTRKFIEKTLQTFYIAITAMAAIAFITYLAMNFFSFVVAVHVAWWVIAITSALIIMHCEERN